MLILSRVCVDFHDRRHHLLFSVKPNMLLTFQEAPDAIQEDPIFDRLVADGSLEAAVPAARRKSLENDPVSSMDPTGKLVPPSTPEPDSPAPDETSPASSLSASPTSASPDTESSEKPAAKSTRSRK